jgi:hypothetical protein|tara:strand:- start:663 stop:965 length:303 start_codon:yes stop_codon:yes gene_type:complete
MKIKYIIAGPQNLEITINIFIMKVYKNIGRKKYKMSSQEQRIAIIKRQTDYSEEIIIEKLKIHDNNIENILKEYLGVQDKNEELYTSNNQKIFKVIRENY